MARAGSKLLAAGERVLQQVSAADFALAEPEVALPEPEVVLAEPEVVPEQELRLAALAVAKTLVEKER